MSDLPPRRADESALTLVQLMLPSDANPMGNVHGGTLMKLADTAGGICAARHTRQSVVTAVMDSMTFERPVRVGDLAMIRARVTWTGRTSLETLVTIDTEKVPTGEVQHVSTAYFVYVAIDTSGTPVPVRPLLVETDEERQLWQEAEERRTIRLRAAKQGHSQRR